MDQTNLSIYQGDDFAADVEVFNADGSAADLTGYTAQSQIRYSLTDAAPNPAAQFSTSIQDNIIAIVLTHDVTQDLGKQTYVWDLQVIDGNGWITTLLYGQVNMIRDVTRIYTPSMALG